MFFCTASRRGEEYFLVVREKDICRISMDGARTTALVSIANGRGSVVDYDYRYVLRMW